MDDPLIIIRTSEHTPEELLAREWIVTNGLGGYASGTLSGINTRRYHGTFIPNLPAPYGRTMLMQVLAEHMTWGENRVDINQAVLKEFRLDWKVPTWIYEKNEVTLEKRIFMPYGFNTVCVLYRLLKGGPVQFILRPYGSCRKHNSVLGYPREWPFTVSYERDRFEVTPFAGSPVIRMTLQPFVGKFMYASECINDFFCKQEYSSGMDHLENLFSPGFFTFELKEETICFVVSTEAWDAIPPDTCSALESELERRKKLVAWSEPAKHDSFIAELMLAADQFIIMPKTRASDASREAETAAARTVIAGYHWFTDWGRDTMISLEGLTLCTGRSKEARTILQTFSKYVRNGLIPNLFPEGDRQALYNTADATFWFFHALDRYLHYTADESLLKELYPILESVITAHRDGTDFGIGMDASDGLLRASAEGYQLTWMDAKVDEWVVTPRRGKPVEIQALWYNALKLMDAWSGFIGKQTNLYQDMADKAFASFNSAFWSKEGGYLYDVIEMSGRPDVSLRPNQIFAVSLHFPVLEKSRWQSVVKIVEERLLTPYGLRTLETTDRNYHSRYEGSIWERDAAYHQGLVWTWLIGPYLDAAKKVHHDETSVRKNIFESLKRHLGEGGIGTISEIFDGDPPHTPRGCIAQAWSVAEVLRSLVDK